MAVTTVSSNTLGNMLKIVSKGGIVNNLSEDSSIWQNVLKQHVAGDSKGRQLRYATRTTLGSAATGFLSTTGGSYLAGSQSTVNEGIAEWKDFGATIEVDRTVIEKALQDFDSYGKPLVEELDLKAIALSRILSASVYGDGTGVIVEALDAGTHDSVATVTFNVDTTDTAKGFIGWVEEGDILYPVNPDGTAANPTGTSFAQYEVDSIDRDNGTLTLTAQTSAGVNLSDVSATGITAGDFLVRTTAANTQDIGTIIASLDFNTASFAFTGLDILTQDGGELCNAITLSGNASGSRQDESGNPIDSQAFQKMMSKLMRRAGKGRYTYDQACMAWETYDSLIESREVDRRFMSVQDNKKGVNSMAYIHGRNSIMFDPDEFCPKKRIYFIPNKGALQFHGTDFDFVQPNGNDKFHLKAGSSGSYDRIVQSFMEGSGTLISPHNAALGCIHNFT